MLSQFRNASRRTGDESELEKSMLQGNLRALNLETIPEQSRTGTERIKAEIGTKVGDPFRVIRCRVRKHEGTIPWSGREHSRIACVVYAE